MQSKTYTVKFSFGFVSNPIPTGCGGSYEFSTACPMCDNGRLEYDNVFANLMKGKIIQCDKCEQYFKLKENASIIGKSTLIKSVKWVDDGIQRRWSDESIQYRNKTDVYMYDVKLKRLDKKEYEDTIEVFKIIIDNVGWISSGNNYLSMIKDMCGERVYVFDKLMELKLLNYCPYYNGPDLFIPEIYQHWMEMCVEDKLSGVI